MVYALRRATNLSEVLLRHIKKKKNYAKTLELKGRTRKMLN